MKTLLKVALTILAVPVALVAIAAIFVAILYVYLHFETEHKVMTALESRYPHATISINDRVDWKYVNEICFDVTVHPKSGAPSERKIIMVTGDSDGGTWGVGSRHEYTSMITCKRDFWRG